MKAKLTTLIAIGMTSLCFGQTDTIYSNNEKISCIIKEITPDGVKFSYPGEDMTTTIYKNVVQKIIMKSGRVQTFSEATSFKTVNDVNDYQNVSVTQIESEVKGLFKVGEVSSKAKGTTTMSNQERVKERAYRKLKLQAAIQGGNIIYLTNQRTDGNKQGGYYQSGSQAETNLTGVVYTNKLPSFNDFQKNISNNKEFKTVLKSELYSSASDISDWSEKKTFTINELINENGLIMIVGKLQGVTKYTKFRVVSFDKDFFNIYYEDKSSSYNIKVKI